MEIINLTKHNVTVIDGNNNIIEFSPSGIEARCKEITIYVDEYNGIPVYETEYDEVEDLPEPKEGTIYIVSTLVRLACPNRKDLVSPAKPVRNEAGQIIGCTGFNR